MGPLLESRTQGRCVGAADASTRKDRLIDTSESAFRVDLCILVVYEVASFREREQQV